MAQVLDHILTYKREEVAAAKAAVPEAEWLGGRNFARLGSSLTGRGDPDGSGWTDLLLGARGWADSSSTGGAGNATGGRASGSPRRSRRPGRSPSRRRRGRGG